MKKKITRSEKEILILIRLSKSVITLSILRDGLFEELFRVEQCISDCVFTSQKTLIDINEYRRLVEQKSIVKKLIRRCSEKIEKLKAIQ